MVSNVRNLTLIIFGFKCRIVYKDLKTFETLKIDLNNY